MQVQNDRVEATEKASNVNLLRDVAYLICSPIGIEMLKARAPNVVALDALARSQLR